MNSSEGAMMIPALQVCTGGGHAFEVRQFRQRHVHAERGRLTTEPLDP